MDKLTIVIIVGTDGTGKTTTKKLVEQRSNYKYLVFDRFSDSIVYDKIYGRTNRDKQFYKLEKNIDKIANVFLIYLDCDIDTQMERIRGRGEVVGDNYKQGILKAKQYFSEYLNKTPLKNITLNTDKYNIDEVTDKIIEFVENE